jgi:hypothetical protein
MKTTIDLPDDLLKEVKLLAVHEGSRVKDLVAALLREALAAAKGRATVVRAGKAAMKRRGELTRKFVSGEWGLALTGHEAAEEADRKSEKSRETAWRK